MNRRQAWIDIIFALILVGVSAIAVGLISAFMGQHQFFLLLALQGIAILLGLRFLLAVRGQSWRHLGLQVLTLKDLGRALIGFVSCMGANMVLTTLVFITDTQSLKQHVDALKIIGTQLSSEISFAGIAALMFFVGVYEEIMARGFLLARCRLALGGLWGPVLLSSFLFGLGHLYQGWIGVAQTTLFGIVLAILTVRWGTLWPAIFAHAMLNIFSLAILEQFAEQSSFSIFQF
ncbi:Abortive infection protein [Nitrosococcus oceani ATCC 19707]|uniref:Abortive infection protein n=2 Tax=Nitrosococcus oceani TaxID=1229 RepID=Q3J9W1_NITOC|nr:type II CAAX endopeptidase family protein [Nitrosococcus oceani]ABA58385.1 Abortive infection protein [Nitrosococcus oceani ATCC 19707]EDZ67526.1 CAAX amino terminal protease family [Nitrosococcus oceani AFC27]KFI19193.1 abortive infection protein [Nitrosococcus oceani C-27]GEM18779.1 CPBP family intramembrane metalloprotease [Nitrosococcus oceani]